MRASAALALVASATTALAQIKGFNYGSASTSGAPFTQADFENQFRTAANLVGTSGFTAARLFTTVQAGTQNTVISAIPAALATNTKLLLGLWASGGDQGFANEIQALKTAIQQFPQLSSSLVGISVGSEDLYRISPAAAQAGSVNPGAQPSTLVNYIRQVRDAIAGTPWSAAPIGHVDTWTAFANGSNDAVSAAVDFVGVDAYPYFQTADANSVDNGASLFQAAINGLTATAKSKQIWITETGWPTQGQTLNQGVPSIANAKKYWDAVGCGLLFGKYSHAFWYTLQDAGAPDPNFGIVGATLSTTPLFDLSCPSVTSSSSASSAAATSSSAAAAGSSSAAATSAAASSAAGTSAAGASAAAGTTSATGSTGTAVVGGSGSSSGVGANAPSTVVTQTVNPTGQASSGNGTGASIPGSGASGNTTTVAGSGNGSSASGSTPSAATSTRPAQNTNAASVLDSTGSALLAVLAGGAVLAF